MEYVDIFGVKRVGEIVKSGDYSNVFIVQDTDSMRHTCRFVDNGMEAKAKPKTWKPGRVGFDADAVKRKGVPKSLLFDRVPYARTY